jgi:RND family efflux transporter MFP subunit
MTAEKKENLFKRLLKRKKLLIVIFVIIVAGFGIYRFTTGDGDVDTVEVKLGTVREEIILTGEVKAVEHSALRFQGSGRVSWVGVSEGEEVKKGQSLMRLDTTNLSQDLKIADANLRSSAAALDVVYDDLQGKEDSETFSETSTRTTAEAAKDITVYSNIKAQRNLSNLTLRAPFAGIVTFLANPFTGATVLFNETQVEVVNPETVYFEVSADQSEVIDLFEGQKVNLILDSFSDDEFEGKIDFISYSPMAGEVGTAYKVKIIFVGGIDASKLRIGMTGDAKFVVSERDNVLYLPPKYINSDTSGKYVNLEKKNNKVNIEVGIEGEERVEVIGDVEEGDTVYD